MAHCIRRRPFARKRRVGKARIYTVKERVAAMRAQSEINDGSFGDGCAPRYIRACTERERM